MVVFNLWFAQVTNLILKFVIFNYKVLINLTMNYIKHIEDVHKMCRICLCKSKNMVCFNDNIDETENSQSIITYLETNFSVKVNTSSIYPKEICLICLDLIRFTDEFKPILKQIYQKSQIILAKYLNLSVLCNDDLIKTNLQKQLCLPLPKTNDIEHLTVATTNNEPEEEPATRLKETQPKTSKFRCTHCSRSFASKRNVWQHSKICKKRIYQCEYCLKKFRSVSLKRSHIRIAHKIKPENVTVKCTMCDEEFKNKSARAYHTKIKHNPEETVYPCEICGKTFVIKNSLKLHMGVHNKDRTVVVCQLCGKGFHYAGGLYYHMKVHRNERNYKCTYCEKVFLNMAGLKRHVRTHTGERPYQCTLCPKTFCSSVEVKTHILRHTGEGRHKCPYCDRRYATRYNLQFHMTSHSGREPCRFCYRSFLNEEVLKLHMRFKHRDVKEMLIDDDTLVDESGMELNDTNINSYSLGENVEFIVSEDETMELINP